MFSNQELRIMKLHFTKNDRIMFTAIFKFLKLVGMTKLRFVYQR